MLELLLFVFLGMFVGVGFGLVPGLHPNFLIILAPLLFAFAQENILAFVVAMAVANAISNFLPSILFGAPEEGTELSVSPGHRMLLEGHGYQAVKLAVAGGLLSTVVLAVLFPAVVLVFPIIYTAIQPVLFFLLFAISLYMVLTEKRKIVAAVCFVLAGAVGLYLPSFPLDSSVALFPVLSGLFGASVLIMQLRQTARKIEKQKQDEYTSRRLVNRSVLFGSLGGMFAGLLPGVGTSQIASLATVDKNEKSFLVTLGALATSNIVISIISLWLISKARSGASVILSNVVSLSMQDALLIIFIALFVAGLASIITLEMAKKFLRIIEQLNYVFVSKIVFLIIIITVLIFAGIYGLLLFAVCTSLGVFAYLSKIRMSVLMAVLLLPTIIFYYPF